MLMWGDLSALLLLKGPGLFHMLLPTHSHVPEQTGRQMLLWLNPPNTHTRWMTLLTLVFEEQSMAWPHLLLPLLDGPANLKHLDHGDILVLCETQHHRFRLWWPCWGHAHCPCCSGEGTVCVWLKFWAGFTISVFGQGTRTASCD